jgi:tRNA1Val (adenine37-N6)-methyltransferase
MKHLMQFKHFSVRHDRVAMKVGMDGVLLGAWTSVQDVKSILDIGTGSGIIALMLAQRTSDAVRIDAVEVSDDIHQAEENFNASPWKHRLRAFHTSVQEFEAQEPYDLLVTNPPYYVNALKPPDPKRERARHDRLLGHDEIVAAATRLLAAEGRLSVILPWPFSKDFGILAARKGLYSTRICDVHSKPERPPIRRLMELGSTPSPLQRSSLCLLDPQGNPSDDYRALLRNFYRNFNHPPKELLV